jgi:hypothetical protein
MQNEYIPPSITTDRTQNGGANFLPPRTPHITTSSIQNIISAFSASVVLSQFVSSPLPLGFVSSYSSLTGLIENVERDDVLSGRLPVLPLLRGL